MSRKHRGGRPPKQNVPRTPSGQISRSIANPDFGPTPELLAQRARIIAAETGLQLEGWLLCSEDAGWSIGRLYLAGRLGDLCREGERAKALLVAASRYWRRSQIYEGLLMAPKRPAAAGGPRGRDTSDKERLYVRVKAEYEASFEALKEQGVRVALAVARALRDEPTSLDLLLDGLSALNRAEDVISRAGRRALERYDALHAAA